MTSCGAAPHWSHFALLAGYAALEYWLGRTDKVKAGSVAEAILNGLTHVGLAVILGAAMLVVAFFFKPENKNEQRERDDRSS